AHGTQRWEIILRAHVRNMEHAMLAHPAMSRVVNTNFNSVNRHRTKMRPRNGHGSLAQPQLHVIDSTNPGGALDDGIEYRLHVRRRTADNAEHLRRCRLMLQRLAQFGVALLQFLEQSHVLDGDDRLSGKGLKQFDLSFCEWTNLRSPEDD